MPNFHHESRGVFPHLPFSAIMTAPVTLRFHRKHMNTQQRAMLNVRLSGSFDRAAAFPAIADAWRHLPLRFNALKIHLICPTLSTRNSSTAMRHTALLLGTFAFSTVFCKGRWRKEEGRCAKLKRLDDFLNVCRFPGAVGLSPRTADPPAAS